MDSAYQKSTTKPTYPASPNQQDRRQPLYPRRQYKRRRTGSDSERKETESEDETRTSMSDSEEHELGSLSSDGEVDEESGLASEDRRKFARDKKRSNRLDDRIGEGPAKADAREADRNVLRKLSTNAVLIGLWYLFSLSISIYNKWMFSSDHLDFHFPLFTTALHMLVQFILASTILLIFPSLRPSQPQPPPSQHGPPTKKPLVTALFYLTRLVPTGTTTSLDIGLGNTSLRYITLTFYTMCKSSVLLFVLLFAFLFRLETPSIKLCLIIFTMTAGVLMMVAGETAYNALGFVLAISASFFSGFRWALTQILLLRHPATSNPFATLFFLAPIMFVTLFVIAIFSETPSAVMVGVRILIHDRGAGQTILLLLVPGFLAFCMIAAEFTLLQRTSVVTLSICGIFKEVITISAAGIVFHDELSAVNVSGLLVTIAAIASYNYFKITTMRREALQKLNQKNAAAGVEEHEASSREAVADVRAFSAEEDELPLMQESELEHDHEQPQTHDGDGNFVAGSSKAHGVR